MLKMTDVRAFNDADLVERLDSSKQELMKLREKVATRQIEDTSQIRQVKGDIARLMSERHARELRKIPQGEVES